MDFFKLANRAGINKLLLALTKDQARIFSLHGVWPDMAGRPWVPLRQQIDVSEFEAVLREFRKNFDFVSMDEVVRKLKGGHSTGRRLATLTFDDGYLNNFTVALPVLEELEVPATFFIATGMVEKKHVYWFDRLDVAISKSLHRDFSINMGGREFRFKQGERAAAIGVFKELRNHCKAWFESDTEFLGEVDRVVRELEDASGIYTVSAAADDDPCAVIGEEDVSAFACHELVEFGSHTVSHSRGGRCGSDQFLGELNESKSRIEKWTGKPCKYFAYPNGDFGNDAAKLVQDAGYAAAFTTVQGCAKRADNIFTLPRLAISSGHSKAKSVARASGFEAIVESVRRT